MTRNAPRLFSVAAFTLAVWVAIERAQAVEIESMGKALASLIGAQGVKKKSVPVGGKEVSVFFTRSASGKVARAAFIEKGIYPPNCTHTWAIGINPANGTVTQVRVVEMSCPHAFPTKTAQFLDQYKGKGPADLATMSSEIDTVAKATGSCVLTTDAVKRSIVAFQKIKSQL